MSQLANSVLLPERTAGRWPAGNADRWVGWLLFLVACTALGIAELAFQSPLPQLHLFGNPPLVLLMGTILAGFSPMGFLGRGRAFAAGALAGSWGLAFVLATAAALARPTDLLGWVPASKTALFTLAALEAGIAPSDCQPAIARALRLSFGLIMIFYALVHVLHRELIAGMIPAWIPAREFCPWMTALILGVCGGALVDGRLARPAAATLSLMFAAWIILLHVERLVREPGSLFEWSFALSALALMGVALMVQAKAAKPRLPGLQSHG